MKKQLISIPILILFLIASCAKDTIEFNSTVNYGSFTDTRNDEVYKTVEIGNQVWMAENLRSISNDPNVVNYCNYGKLYKTSYLDEKCPEGWHLPDSSEWQILIDFLGGNKYAGGILKETGNTHWESPNTGATNSSGFTALGAGTADYLNGLRDRKKTAEFWTSTPYSDEYGHSSYSYYYISLEYNDESVHFFNSTEDPEAYEQKSIRCIKD